MKKQRQKEQRDCSWIGLVLSQPCLWEECLSVSVSCAGITFGFAVCFTLTTEIVLSEYCNFILKILKDSGDFIVVVLFGLLFVCLFCWCYFCCLAFSVSSVLKLFLDCSAAIRKGKNLHPYNIRLKNRGGRLLSTDKCWLSLCYTKTLKKHHKGVFIDSPLL